MLITARALEFNRKMYLSYRVSVWCGCCIPSAEWLHSSAVGIAQLAHAVDECILCHEGWRCGLPKLLWGGLVFNRN